MLCYKNKCFDELFNKFLLSNKKVITSSNNMISIYFYEWSDINNCPKRFNDIESFIKFLK